MAEEDFIDRVDDALTVSACGDEVRGRLSGTLDLEAYQFDRTAQGLIATDHAALFNPRLSLFLDAQIGPWIYAFAQARIDRGFDPADRRLEFRLDESALRISPGTGAALNLQVGKFATVVGNWTHRHDSWDNPFVTAPLPYDNLTGIWDAQAARSAPEILAWAGVRPKPDQGGAYLRRDLSLPVIWGPSYASGAAGFGRWGKFDYAAEVKNTALASRPETWSPTETNWSHPAFNARIGYEPTLGWNFGVSFGTGPYLRTGAEATLPVGQGLGDYRETLFGQDVGFAWHHFQAWAEVYETRFAVPAVATLATTAYYAEGKYAFTPQWFGALRWNQQLFSSLADGRGGTDRWGRNVWRIDGGPGYRFTPHSQVKLQYSLQREDADSRRFGDLIALQFTVKF
jgi:hypothetical protein